jgi:HEPN domain-containing protein
MNRWADWLDQAGSNLEHARRSIPLGDHAWACFAAQQAAEAAVKALHLRAGNVAWGHSVLDLLSALPERVAVDADLIDAARVLDKYYIPTRYPDAHPAGSAARHYTAAEAEQAVAHAAAILEHCGRPDLDV